MKRFTDYIEPFSKNFISSNIIILNIHHITKLLILLWLFENLNALKIKIYDDKIISRILCL
ncbi:MULTISPECIES: hypothetical protein [unclassified Campylobacter]|uniref:hypothetical protein n=1 Tax=unclassified Campylobacter TaxID=2593542 RepID=UPI000EAAC7CA|nr:MULTISPECIES: hypothetical protein [unclassified Campylobacter]QOR01297.1 hypothetical protein A0083_00660 [Campylobacter sp. 2014D-0216]RKO64306.1 hypothetical protein CKA54_06135 [Campylobacter sp. P255]